MLRKSGKPVVVGVNKADQVGQTPPDAYEFYNLGLGDIFPISSAHRLGLGELLDEVFDYFPAGSEDGEDEQLYPGRGHRQAECRQVLAGQQDARPGAHDRLRYPGHNPRRDRLRFRQSVRPLHADRHRRPAQEKPHRRQRREIQHDPLPGRHRAGRCLPDPDRRR